MSFILDALRKAEDKNRDRHNLTIPAGPHVVTEDMPEAPPTKGVPLLVWIVSGLIVAGLVGWLLTGSKSDSSPTQPAQPSKAQRAPAQPTSVQRAPEQSSPQNSVPAQRSNTRRETGARALDREAQRGLPERRSENAAANSAAPRQAATEPSGAAQTTPSTRRVTPGTVQILNADGTAPTGVTPGVVEQEALPEYQTSLTSGDVPIPELHLDMHVYSAEPEKRFVFINLEKYGEGDAITSDTTIESIEPKGAVINHKGYRFVLLPD